MQQIVNLLTQGEIKPALEALQNRVNAEDEKEVIALLAEYNRNDKAFKRGLQGRKNKILNRITQTALDICKKYGSLSTPTTFATPPQLDNLPLDKDGYLLGRKAALEQLHANLQGKHIVTLVNGMGGIGKSTLAAFYAHFPLYKAAYTHCYWVAVSDLTGEVEEAIINTFAQPLSLYQLSKEAQLQKIAAHLSALHGKALLILDNANHKEQVNKSLAFLRNCGAKVLFTSRANMQNIASQALAKLLPEDAFTLFTHYYPAAATMPQTQQLLKNIDYHTLLTEFMAKSLAHNATFTLQDLIDITAQQNFTDELLTYTQFTSYHTHTHQNPDTEIQPAKYLLQIFPIDNLTEQEQTLLRYFSILPAEWIGIDMLKQLFIFNLSNLKNTQNRLLKLIVNLSIKILKLFHSNQKEEELKLGAILQSLYEKGWLQKSPANEFSCHILVQHILRQQLQPNAENCKVVLRNLFAAIYFDGYTNQLTLTPYLPLVTAVLTWVKEDTQLIANIYNNSAVIYQTIGNYSQALSYNVENVRIKEKILLTEDTDLATAYSNIAGTYEKLGNYQKSLEYGLKALAIREKVLSAEHPNLATSYNNIALTYEYLGNYQKSLEYGLKALTIFEKVLSDEHPDLATSYNNIGETYRLLSNYQQALTYGLKASTIFEKVLSAKHPNLATSYNNIALTYEYLGNYQKSLEYGLKALTICEKVLSAEHPDLAQSYNNIAVTYYYLKDYQTAYSYIQQAVVIRTKVLPKGHPDIQIALDAKAVIEKAMRGG